VTSAAYHRDETGRDQPSLSKSILHLLLEQSPAHAWAAHPKLNPDFEAKDEARFDIGTASHSILLEGVDKIEVCPYPDWRTKAAQEQRDEARANGLVPLLVDQAQTVRAMIAAIRSQLEQHDCRPVPFTDGKPEQTIVWEEDGVLCRALVDWIRDDLVAVDDLKTTSASADPRAWTRRTMWTIGAGIQARWYQRGMKAVHGVEPDFRFVVAETSPPYAISVVDLAPAAIALADAQIDYGLTIWKECLATDTWPAYPRQVASAEPPAWMEADWLERGIIV
jgi:PDDEXK-like domain of unknown function (DUF3799)